MFTKAFRIGNEPEIRFTPGGDPVMSLSLAYSYGRKGQDGKRPTQWLEASLWGKQAEALQPYLTKGGQVVATVDDMHIETYQGKNGEGHKLAGRIVNIELIGGRSESSKTAQTTQKSKDSSGSFDSLDDDIPF